MAFVGCCPKFVKLGMLILTCLTMCLGIATVAVFAVYGNNSFFTSFNTFFANTSFSIAVIIWIIVGFSTALVIITFILFFGVLYERKIILKIVTIALAFHIAANVVIGAIICVQYDNYIQVLDSSAITFLNTYSQNPTNAAFIDSVQKTVQCCGWYNETDWSHTPWYTSISINSSITYYTPLSCCNCTSCTYPLPCQANPSLRFAAGCKSAGKTYILNILWILVGLFIPEFFITIIFFGCSIYLQTNIGREEYKYS